MTHATWRLYKHQSKKTKQRLISQPKSTQRMKESWSQSLIRKERSLYCKREVKVWRVSPTIWVLKNTKRLVVKDSSNKLMKQISLAKVKCKLQEFHINYVTKIQQLDLQWVENRTIQQLIYSWRLRALSLIKNLVKDITQTIEFQLLIRTTNNLAFN